MGTHEFTVVIDHELSAVELRALLEEGCQDTAPVLRDGRTAVYFHRAAPTLAEALTCALGSVGRAGLRVIAVHNE